MSIRKLKGSQSDREDVHSITSDTPGFAGVAEVFLRRFRNLAFVLLLSPVVLVCLFCMGISFVPGIALVDWVNTSTAEWGTISRYVVLGLSLVSAYALYGVSLIFVVPLINFLNPLKVKPWRGIWYSLPAIPWFVHNALTYIVRFTFLELVTPTPLNILFYRMMGMKIGKGVVINTTNISDPSLIELGDYVTIGGSATLFAHYGQKGYLIISPVKIGRGTTIGLKASVMGGCTVGENCNIKPHTVLLPKSEVSDGETL